MNMLMDTPPTPGEFLNAMVAQFGIIPPEQPFGVERTVKENLAALTFYEAYGHDHPLSQMIKAYRQAVNLHLWRPDEDDLLDLSDEIADIHQALQAEIMTYVEHARS